MSKNNKKLMEAEAVVKKVFLDMNQILTDNNNKILESEVKGGTRKSNSSPVDDFCCNINNLPTTLSEENMKRIKKISELLKEKKGNINIKIVP